VATQTQPENDDNKSQGLYLQLLQDVLTGRFPPGARLSEASLGRTHRVSRTPIREAIARLEHDGLLEREGGIVRVRQRDSEQIIDIYRVRVVLEVEIARDAAERHREFDLRRLRAACEAEKEVPDGDWAAVQAANREFHEALAAASHNEVLEELQSRLTLQIGALQGTTLAHPGRLKQARSEHAQIVKAVAARDADTAGTIAQRHMTKSQDLRLGMYLKADRVGKGAG
jgi:DNA-binding GntR family transcriptional regulator